MLIDPSVKQSGSERAKAQGTNAVQEPHAMRNNCHIDGSKGGAAGWWCVQEESGGRGCPAMRSRGLRVRSCDNDETCESPIHDGRACARIKYQAIYESATRQRRRQDQQCLAARTVAAAVLESLGRTVPGASLERSYSRVEPCQAFDEV